MNTIGTGNTNVNTIGVGTNRNTIGASRIDAESKDSAVIGESDSQPIGDKLKEFASQIKDTSQSEKSQDGKMNMFLGMGIFVAGILSSLPAVTGLGIALTFGTFYFSKVGDPGADWM